MRKCLKSYLTLIVCSVSAVLVVSCSDAPEQYDTVSGTPPRFAGMENKGPGALMQLKVPATETGQSMSDKARQNSQQPIIYGKGANSVMGVAGITTETDFADAREKLTPPFYVSGDYMAYESGVHIIWRLKKPRKPVVFLITPTYLGGLKVGGRFGELHMGQELRTFFEGDPKGEKFIVDLYNALEEKEDGFSCLAERICSITYQNGVMLMNWGSKFGFFVTDDQRKTLYQMNILRTAPQGRLAADLDLASGSFDVEEPAIQVGVNKWGNMIEAIFPVEENQVNPYADVYTNSLTKDFGSVRLGFSKSTHERDYVEPNDEEVLKLIVAFTSYTNKLKLNGKFIQMKPDADGKLQLELVEDAEAENLLVMSPNVPAQYRLPLAKKLRVLVTEEMKKASPGAVIVGRLTGDDQDSSQKSYDAEIVKWDPATESGMSVSFSVKEKTGNLGSVVVQTLNQPFDKVSIPALTKPMNAAGKSLAGFKLLDTVEIKNIDRGVGEADIKIGETEGRADYNHNVTMTGSYASGRQIVNMKRLDVGSQGVAVGVLPMQSQPDGSIVGKILSISTNSHLGGVANLCGLKDFGPALGDRDTDVKAKLDAAISGANGDLLKAKEAEKEALQASTDASVAAAKSAVETATRQAAATQSLVGTLESAASDSPLGAEVAKLQDKLADVSGKLESVSKPVETLTAEATAAAQLSMLKMNAAARAVGSAKEDKTNTDLKLENAKTAVAEQKAILAKASEGVLEANLKAVEEAQKELARGEANLQGAEQAKVIDGSSRDVAITAIDKVAKAKSDLLKELEKQMSELEEGDDSSQLQSEIGQVKQLAQSYNDELKKLRQEKETSQEAFDEKISSAKAFVQQAKLGLKETENKLTLSKQALAKKQDELGTILATFEDVLASVQARADTANGVLARAEEELERLKRADEASKEVFQTRLGDAQAIADAAKKQLEAKQTELKTQLDEKSKALDAETKGSLAELKAKKEELAANLESLKKAEEAQADALSEQKQKLEDIDRAIEEAKNAVVAGFDCPVEFDKLAEGQTGRISAIIFVKERVKLSFSGRELSAISIYAHPTEVN